jgi:hypothetical protein
MKFWWVFYGACNNVAIALIFHQKSWLTFIPLCLCVLQMFDEMLTM